MGEFQVPVPESVSSEMQIPTLQASAAERALRVTYFLLSFPELTQTFVFNEMRHLQALGADINVLSLHAPRDDMSGLPESYGFGRRVHYVDARMAKPGKLERMRIAASSALSLLGAGKGQGVWRLLTVNWRDAPLPRWLTLAVADGFRRHAADADVIHSHFGPAGRIVAHLKALGLVKTRATTVFHGYDVTQYLDGKSSETYRQLFEKIDLLLPISDLWRLRLIEMGAPSAKVETLRLGIDCEDFDYRPRPVAQGNPIRFITVGRMTEKKGHRYTLEAFAGLVARRPDLAAHLDLIGNGPELEEMHDLVDELGLSAQATVHGGLPHEKVRDLLNRANVFVLPSVTAADGDMEGIPVSIMEAMAMGLPVVSTRHSGIPELVADGISGVLVAERDTPALTDAFERLIDTPGLIVRMGLAGRSIIERNYSATLQGAALRTRLERLRS